MSSFQDLDRIPEFHNAWVSIERQLQSEGASPLDIQAAKDLLADSYSGLVGQQMQVDTRTALKAATKYVVADRSISGAIDAVDGLITTATSNAPPQQVVQAFTGTLVGLSVAAGALSAGVGAAIVGAVGLGLSLLQSIGFFGNSDPGSDICGRTWRPPPQWAVGCVGIYGDRVPTPANRGWRKFPDPNHPETWPWGSSLAPSISMAFPAYDRLMCDVQVQGVVGDFYRTFFAAWKANNEFALNGLKAQPDWQVLRQVLRLWNRTRSPQTTFVFEPRTNDLSDTDASCASRVPYIAILVDEMLRFDPDVQTDLPGGVLRINTGPRATRARIPIDLTQSSEAGSSVSLATGTAIAAGVGFASVAVYSWATHQSITSTLSKIWRGIKRGAGGR